MVWYTSICRACCSELYLCIYRNVVTCQHIDSIIVKCAVASVIKVNILNKSLTEHSDNTLYMYHTITHSCVSSYGASCNTSTLYICHSHRYDLMMGVNARGTFLT